MNDLILTNRVCCEHKSPTFNRNRTHMWIDLKSCFLS